MLQQISHDSLSGNQQLFLTFATQNPGVDIPDHLKSTYPEEMTIVLQYEFENMSVFENHFSVSLVFESEMERITIPFTAIIHIQDPNNDLDLELEPVSVYDLSVMESQTPDIAPDVPEKQRGRIINLENFQD